MNAVSILDEYKEKLTSIQYFESNLKEIVSGFSELQRYIDLIKNVSDVFSGEEGIIKELIIWSLCLPWVSIT